MKNSTYKTIRKIHLYASLPIVCLLLMYVISSYFMIHNELFNTYQRQETTKQVNFNNGGLNESDWSEFLIENGIRGKLTDESTRDGILTRNYYQAGTEYQIRIDTGESQAEIKTIESNLPGYIVALHRIRGYEGPWPYRVYAFLLDVVGISLILFSVTGAILWLKLLKNDPWAWIVFFAGLLYVGAVVGYLMLN